MRTRQHLLRAAAALCLGCGDDGRAFFSSDAGSSSEASADARSAGTDASADRPVAPVDAALPEDMTLVYAHSDTALYAVDPRTNALRAVGNFSFPAGDTHHHAMTDLAVDAQGNVVGNSSDALFRVDPNTAACTLLTALPGNHLFVGLTYVPVGVLDAANEVLVGGATDGTYWRIDPSSGNATQLGQFRGGWGLSGDLVSIDGAATYATVRTGTGTRVTDSLATLDPHTGQLTIVGDTGFSELFGLGYWRQNLYAFSRSGQFVVLDARTGRGRLVSTPATQFSGAGVTTLAPITPQ